MAATGNRVDLMPVDTGSAPPRRLSRSLLVFGMAAACALAVAFRWLTLSEFLNDHFDHVALAQQLRLGALPLRDFVDEGMPLTYVISAEAWALLKAPFFSEAVVLALGFAIAASLSFRVTALMTRSFAAATFAVAAQVALYPRTYSYPKLLVQAVAITVAWWAVKRPTGRRIAALSAATALGYYFRHDHAVYLGAAIVALLVVAQWRTGLTTVARSIALYAGLVAVCVLPHLLYVQWAIGLPTYVAIARAYVGSEAESGAYRLPVPHIDPSAGLWIRPETPAVNVRWTPGLDDDGRKRLELRYHLEMPEHDEGSTWRYRVRDTSAANLRSLRNDPSVDDTHGFERLNDSGFWKQLLTGTWLGPGWRARENSLAVLVWLAWMLPFLALAMVIARRHDLPNEELAIVVMLSVLAFCTDLVFLRSPLDVRLPDLAVSHTVLGAWMGAVMWRWPARGSRRLLSKGLVVVATMKALFAIALLAQTGTLVQTTGILRGLTGVAQRWRDVTAQLYDESPGPVPSNPSAVVLPFIEYVRECTDRQDRLFYAWYAPEIYVVAHRGFAGDHRRLYRALRPWEQARTIARFQQQRVPFVIIPLPRKEWFEISNPDIYRYVQQHYVHMATIPPDDPGGFEILRESSWTGNGVYRTTNWPCVR